MKVLTPGHWYEVKNFENKEGSQTIQFIEKWPYGQIKGTIRDINMTDDERIKYQNETDLVTMNDGTTNEELIEVLIDRLNFLQSKFPCRENAIAITNLEQALMWLEKRTKDRLKRNVEGKNIA